MLAIAERRLLEDLGTDGRVTLKLSLKKQSGNED
jgi:hypothetical protein